MPRNRNRAMPGLLPVAVRAYPKPNAEQAKRSRRDPPLPDAMLVFDTETRTDASQRLTFGSYRFIVGGECVEEGLFCADDLRVDEWKILDHYVATHTAALPQLRLLTLRQFLDRFYWSAYKGRCLVVGFNLPFDMSRIARDFLPARGRFAGGFSLGLWSYIDKNDCEHPNAFRPRFGVKQIDSKRALKGFTGRSTPDETDLIPEGSETGEAEKGYKFRGHFLDLRTLAFALTDRAFSLESACEAFGVEHGKQKVARHGEVTEEYVDYNRRDVLATSELAVKLLEEYERHPIGLQATKAYSPASIGKAYLRAMGILPILERQPDFPHEFLGYAESAFFGGRASAHIRKVPVPVVYVDFLSMYPTVNCLMNLWRFVTAREIKVIEHCQDEIVDFLRKVTQDALFEPGTWTHLTAFVKLVPDDDILPCRSKYGVHTNDWQIALNHVDGTGKNSNHALWYALPDVVASAFPKGKIPKIIDAFRLEAIGMLPDLKPIKLRGAVEVDPRNQDFFKVVIEQRKRLASRSDLSPTEKQRLDKALKVLANAASYGIYAEMNRQESEQEVKVECCGIDPTPFTCRVAHREVPGEYCFPPAASLTTSGARLMVALLESCVTELGGTYAMEDTDSMAIVATERGGEVPCPVARLRHHGNRKPPKAICWTQVDEISQRFEALNPYDRGAVPGSILKIESDNFDPKTRKERQLYCLAISAKRYALFLRDHRGVPVLLREGVNNEADRWSEHGLGHLLNPSDPETDDRDWIGQAWLNIVRRSLGLPTSKIGFEDLPAIGRVTVSSPSVMRAFADLNEARKYPDQIKPFNFLLTCHVAALGHPVGANPERFHLVAPYESNPKKWSRLDWIDLYSGKKYRITTVGHHGTRQCARVKTYENVLLEYEFHPEAKCADADGSVCGKQTIGLLQRRHVRIDQIKYIGKESNALEDVESGLVHSETIAYVEYKDKERDEWNTKILPALKRIPLKLLVKKCRRRISRRALIEIRAGRRRPHRKTQALLEKAVQEMFRD